MVKGGKTGVIDRENRTVVPFGKYDYIRYFNDGFSVVSEIDRKGNEKYGAIDRSGKVIVPVQYEYLTNFHEGLAIFHENGKQGYIDTAGRVAIPAVYDDARPFSDGVAWAFTEDDGWTLIKKVNAHTL